MKKLFGLVAAVAIIAVGVTGCDTGSSNGNSGDSKTVDLVVANNSTHAITAIYVDSYTASVKEGLGANRLSTPLAAGARVHISLAAGDYAFRLSYDGQESGYYECWTDKTTGNQYKVTFKANSMPTIYLGDDASSATCPVGIADYEPGDE